MPTETISYPEDVINLTDTNNYPSYYKTVEHIMSAHINVPKIRELSYFLHLMERNEIVDVE